MKTWLTVRRMHPVCPFCHTKQDIFYHNDEHLSSYIPCFNYPDCDAVCKIMWDITNPSEKGIQLDWSKDYDRRGKIITEFVEHKE